MVDFLQQAGELAGMGGQGGFNLTWVIIFFAAAIVLMLVAGVGTWFLIRWYQYKYKIKIFEKINGRFQETMSRRARVVTVGKGSDQAFLLNRPKKILPMPSLQSGKNTYMFFISEDGEWINFEFSDFDDDRRAVGSQFLDKEMRYARTSLQHMGQERYDTKGFWERYGGVIAYVSLIAITMIGLWLIIDKMVEFQGTANGVMEIAKQVLEKTNQQMGNLDNIGSGGSGLIQN